MEFNMKKIAKHFDPKLLIIALAAVISFSMCDDNKGGGGSGPAYYGDKLELPGEDISGDVFIEVWTHEKKYWESGVSYTNYNNNMPFKNTYGGSGNITGGKLSYSIGVPDNLETLEFDKIFDGKRYGNFKSGTARGVVLDALPINSGTFDGLYRGESTITKVENRITVLDEKVLYIYVNNDVTVSGFGWTDSAPHEYEDGDEIIIFTGTFSLEHINLDLKKGWNVVYFEYRESIRFNSDTQAGIEITEAVSLYNPSNLKWFMSMKIPQ
jgi:hypothetical protein